MTDSCVLTKAVVCPKTQSTGFKNSLNHLFMIRAAFEHKYRFGLLDRASSREQSTTPRFPHGTLPRPSKLTSLMNAL